MFTSIKHIFLDSHHQLLIILPAMDKNLHITNLSDSVDLVLSVTHDVFTTSVFKTLPKIGERDLEKEIDFLLNHRSPAPENKILVTACKMNFNSYSSCLK